MEKKQSIKALVEMQEGKMIAVASDNSEDRMGDSLDQEKWDLKNFKKNPVLQAGHDYRPEFTVGKAKNIRIEKNKLMFEPVFHTITPLGKQIGEMYREGFLKAFSVGFIPRAMMDPKNDKAKNELLEISAVAVPANANALLSSAKSYDNNTVNEVKEWVEESEEKTEKEIDISEKPLPNEHACQLKDPRRYDKFRRGSRKSQNGKTYNVVFGIVGDKSEDQSYRYNKKEWTESEAKSHCKSHKGKFEAAQKNKEIAITEENVQKIVAKEIDKLCGKLDEVCKQIQGLNDKSELKVVKTKPKLISQEEMIKRVLKRIAGGANLALKEIKKS